MKSLFLLSLLSIPVAQGFGVTPSTNKIHYPYVTHRYADVTSTDETTATTAATETKIEVDPKEAVKLFGRLAEKYIMLDASGGMCCYSACSDCEYRLPGGGYRMADQSASRPKWIPVYEHRSFESSGKEHTSKWSSEVFVGTPVVTKEEFTEAVSNLSYAPCLGGPYMSASSAKIEDTALVEKLFDVLVGDATKEKLTRHRMHLSMKEMADGEEGLTWPMFLSMLEH